LDTNASAGSHNAEAVAGTIAGYAYIGTLSVNSTGISTVVDPLDTVTTPASAIDSGSIAASAGSEAKALHGRAVVAIVAIRDGKNSNGPARVLTLRIIALAGTLLSVCIKRDAEDGSHAGRRHKGDWRREVPAIQSLRGFHDQTSL
jgi:hypothetical protein